MPGPRVMLDPAPILAALGVDPRAPTDFAPQLGETVGLGIALIDALRIRRPIPQPTGIVSATIAAGGAGQRGVLNYYAPRGLYVLAATVSNSARLYWSQTAVVAGAAGASILPGEVEPMGFAAAANVGTAPTVGLGLAGPATGNRATFFLPLPLWVPPARWAVLHDEDGNRDCVHSFWIAEPYAT